MSATPPGSCAPVSAALAGRREDGTVVLDARDEETFARGHLPGAGRLSLAEFRSRRAELPPRTAPILVVHDEPAAARETAMTLARLQYRHVRWLDAPLADLADGHADRGAPARIWRPSPFLERVLPLLPPGRSLDLAAGAGRESVYLALHGRPAEAWDHAPAALERARDLAARHGVAIDTRLVELEQAELPEASEPWPLIVVFRFLHRPLFAWIERALAPGGALVYETFRTGQEAHGRPRQPRFLLQPGELSFAFPSLRVECYEESEPEGGPVMARLLARKPE